MDTLAYEALHENAALLDLSARGRIRMLGEDRARLLHAMSTNHIQGLQQPGDRKSTRLNSSHANISYAVFCLKKKNTIPRSSIILDVTDFSRQLDDAQLYLPTSLFISCYS